MPAFAGMTVENGAAVMPAQAGIHDFTIHGLMPRQPRNNDYTE